MTGTVGVLTLGFAAASAGGLVILVTDRGQGGVVLGLVVLLPVTLLILAVAALALLEVPAGARHVVRSVARDGTAPVPVRVLGVEPEGGRWFLVPLDGGRTVVVDAFRGRSRIVAGDVVHLWRAPERDGAFADRVALTGPFGTLFPALDTTRDGARIAARLRRPTADDAAVTEAGSRGPRGPLSGQDLPAHGTPPPG